jgi:hypothetical protein
LNSGRAIELQTPVNQFDLWHFWGDRSLPYRLLLFRFVPFPKIRNTHP